VSEFYKHENPHRLFRDREHAMVAGVCAGIAEYFGLNRKGVRLAAVLLLLLPPFFAFVLISYVVLAIVLPILGLFLLGLVVFWLIRRRRRRDEMPAWW
jgi:phage shock protein PspC (stress-responsive transcriptional regulator)